MKSERRHDLQTNVLADWLGGKIAKIQANATWFGFGILLILIVVIFVFVRQNRLETMVSDGWTRLQHATNAGIMAINQPEPLALKNARIDLENLAREYAGEPVASYALLTLGDLLLVNGETQYFLNKTAALAAFQDAARYYEAASKTAIPDDLEGRAFFCLGKSLEWQMKLNQAKEVYRKVKGPYQSEAQSCIRNLDRQGAETFYKQFAEWKPKQEATDENRYGEVDFELQNQSPPSGDEVDAALKNVLDGSGVEDAAEQAESGGGEAPAEEQAKPETPSPAAESEEASPKSPAESPEK